MERIIIVDENDNPIGEKPRDDLDPSDIYRVSALWLTDSDGRILLARRGYNKKYNAGKWGPAVAGTVGADESYYENIKKEIEEELGLKNLKLSEGPKRKVNRKQDKNYVYPNYFVQWYRGVLDRPAEWIKFNKGEVAEVKWFTEKELDTAIQKNPDAFLQSLKQREFLEE